MLYDSVFSPKMVEFAEKSKEGKRKISRVRKRNKSKVSPQEVVSTMDAIADAFVKETEQNVDKAVRGQLVPLLPKIGKKDKSVLADVEKIKWENVLYFPFYNGLWTLWNRAFSAGVLHGREEVPADFSTGDNVVEFAKESNDQKRLSKLLEEINVIKNLQSQEYVKRQVKETLRNPENKDRSYKDIEKEVREKLQNAEAAKLDELSSLQNKMASIKPENKAGKSTTVDKNKKVDPELKENKTNNKEAEPEIERKKPNFKDNQNYKDKAKINAINRARKEDTYPSRANKTELAYAKKLRERTKYEIDQTAKYITPPQNPVLEETKFGEFYVTNRNTYLAKNLSKKITSPFYEPAPGKSIPLDEVSAFIANTSPKREVNLFNSINSKIFGVAAKSADEAAKEEKKRKSALETITDRTNRELQNKYGAYVTVEILKEGEVFNSESIAESLKERRHGLSQYNTTSRAEKEKHKNLIKQYNAILENPRSLEYQKNLAATNKKQSEAIVQSINIEREKARLDSEEVKRNAENFTGTEDISNSSKVVTLTPEEAEVLGVTTNKISIKELTKLETTSGKGRESAEEQENKYKRLYKIASTEVTHAYNLGRLAYYQSVGITRVLWDADAEHLINRNNNPPPLGRRGRPTKEQAATRPPKKTPFACTICATRHSQSRGEPYYIEDILKKTNTEVVIAAHPYCKCTWIPDLEDRDDDYDKDKNKTKLTTVTGLKFPQSIATWALGGGTAILSTALMYSMFKSGIGSTKVVVNAVVKNNDEAKAIVKDIAKELPANVVQDKVEEIVEEIAPDKEEPEVPETPETTEAPSSPVHIPLPKLTNPENVLIDANPENVRYRAELRKLKAKIEAIPKEVSLLEDSSETMEETLRKISGEIEDTAFKDIVKSAEVTQEQVNKTKLNLAVLPQDALGTEEYIKTIKKLSRQVDNLTAGKEILALQIASLKEAYKETYLAIHKKLLAEGYTDSNVLREKIHSNKAIKKLDILSKKLQQQINKIESQDHLTTQLLEIYNRAVADPNFRKAYLESPTVQKSSLELWNELSTGKGAVVMEVSRYRKQLNKITQQLDLLDNPNIAKSNLTRKEILKYTRSLQGSRYYIINTLKKISSSDVDIPLLNELVSSPDFNKITNINNQSILRTYKAVGQELPIFQGELLALLNQLEDVHVRLLSKSVRSNSPLAKELQDLYERYRRGQAKLSSADKRKLKAEVYSLIDKSIKLDKGNNRNNFSYNLDLANFSKKRIVGLKRKYVPSRRFCKYW